MNLRIVDSTNLSKIGTVIECTGKETTDASTGIATLDLTIDPHTANFDKLENEDVIYVDNAVFDWRVYKLNFNVAFRVKIIDRTDSESVSVTCTQLRTAWRTSIWHHSLRFTDMTVREIMNEIISKVKTDSGKKVSWGYNGKKKTTKLTIDKSNDDLDGLDAVDAVKEAGGYDAVCYAGYASGTSYIDGHTPYLIDFSAIKYCGKYIIDDLNLQKLEYTIDTTDSYNRLYLYGSQNSDGTYVTVADANDGKEYVDDFSYIGDEIISHVEYIDGITDASVLLSKAKDMLEEHAKPVESYEVSIADLAALDPSKYKLLDYKIGDKVMIVDKQRKVNTIQSIIKIERDLENPENTVITLASDPVSIIEIMKNGYTKLDK